MQTHGDLLMITDTQRLQYATAALLTSVVIGTVAAAGLILSASMINSSNSKFVFTTYNVVSMLSGIFWAVGIWTITQSESHRQLSTLRFAVRITLVLSVSVPIFRIFKIPLDWHSSPVIWVATTAIGIAAMIQWIPLWTEGSARLHRLWLLAAATAIASVFVVDIVHILEFLDILAGGPREWFSTLVVAAMVGSVAAFTFLLALLLSIRAAD